MELSEYIKHKRPTLSASSIVTYTSILRSLYFKVFHSKDIDTKKFDDSKIILEYLKDVPANKRKTTLSALVVITDNDKYRHQMNDDVKEYNRDISTQEKSPSQEASWMKTDEIKKVFDTLAKHAMLLYKKESLSTTDLQDIQNYILVALLGGIFIPPRRSLDYTNFKIKNIDPELNYLEKKTMVFNSYKTAKLYGKQVIEVLPPLLKILKKWISINPTEWLLFDSKGHKLTPVKLNQRLNNIFGKGKSINAIRHCYLTDKYEDTIKINQDLNTDMKQMGSSMGVSKNYIKKE
jgi:integrase